MTEEEYKAIDQITDIREYWALPNKTRIKYAQMKEKKYMENFLKSQTRTFELRQVFSTNNSAWENGRCVDSFQYQNECGGYTPPARNGAVNG